MNLSNGKQWPAGIVAGILLVITACVVTVYIALLQPIQEDTDMMLDYHTLDANVNNVIIAGIAFDKKYKLTYIGEGVSEEGSRLAYQVQDMQGNPVNTAKISLVLTRPTTLKENITLENPRVENGKYYFDNVKVTSKGRWNILAKVTVADEYRHMNLQSDTMQKNVFEYGFNKPMRNGKANS